ncbi:MAG TPA: hypothetical protein V6D08_20650, partial [Candidatus Obscuribacterales bacterium]
MEFRKPMAAAAASALALGIGVWQPAQADHFTDLLRSYLDSRISSRGRFVPNNAAVITTVDNGIANYRREISSGLASGRLTPDEAARLQAELDHIIALRDTYMLDGGYTSFEAQSMVDTFNRMNSLIATELSDRDTAISVWPYGRQYPRYGANARSVSRFQDRLDARISAALAQGTITRWQANRMRWEARRIENRVIDGEMSPGEAMRRLITLDRR